MRSPHVLTVEDLVVAYDGKPLLHQVGLQVAAGETVALVGESGCGKSTTALAVAGLLPRNASVSGRIAFEGRDLVTLTPRERRRLQGNRMGMVFQEPLSSLNPVLRIGEQITEVLREHTALDARARRARALELLEQVRMPRAAQVLDDYPHALSGGQRQRVMIAIAIACSPRLLIADEPTTALDVTTQAGILALLDQLRREMDMGLLLITHDLGVVSEQADRVLVMHAGRVLESAPTAQLFGAPQHAYTRGLLGASLRKDQPRHYSRERLAEIRVTPQADGQFAFALSDTALRAAAPDAPASSAAPLLQVRGLHKTYARGGEALPAVRDVSFELQPGETLGLVGQSGSGKSTLGKLVLQLVRADSGSVQFRGEDVSQLPERRLKAFRRQAQMVFQDPYGSLNPRHTVGEMLDAVQALHLDLDRTARHRQARAMLDAVGLPADSLGRYPHEFSGGQRQRVGIARALVLKPSLIICDEPVSALDVSVQAQVLNLLADLRQAFGLSYLFISHDLSVVRYIADRVMVMHEGRIVESARHDLLWSAPQHAYTQSLIAAVPGRDPSAAQVAQVHAPGAAPVVSSGPPNAFGWPVNPSIHVCA
jgi:peptide/nickel transport system ATP-binding protein